MACFLPQRHEYDCPTPEKTRAAFSTTPSQNGVHDSMVLLAGVAHWIVGGSNEVK